jgi:hypothetical protein
MPVAPGDDSSDDAPDDNPDGPHPFVDPADPADYAAASAGVRRGDARADQVFKSWPARLKKIPYGKRGRWRPVDGS